MPLLLETDYAELEERGIAYVEDEVQRFFVLIGHQLPSGLYVQASCDVLSVIPTNYNQAGTDMLWTYPQLSRADGKAIPAASEPNSDGRSFQGKQFARWSRHWNQGSSIWKAGKDNVVTILRRIIWAFEHPDTT